MRYTVVQYFTVGISLDVLAWLQMTVRLKCAIRQDLTAVLCSKVLFFLIKLCDFKYEIHLKRLQAETFHILGKAVKHLDKMCRNGKHFTTKPDMVW